MPQVVARTRNALQDRGTIRQAFPCSAVLLGTECSRGAVAGRQRATARISFQRLLRSPCISFRLLRKPSTSRAQGSLESVLLGLFPPCVRLCDTRRVGGNLHKAVPRVTRENGREPPGWLVHPRRRGRLRCSAEGVRRAVNRRAERGPEPDTSVPRGGASWRTRPPPGRAPILPRSRPSRASGGSVPTARRPAPAHAPR